MKTIFLFGFWWEIAHLLIPFVISDLNAEESVVQDLRHSTCDKIKRNIRCRFMDKENTSCYSILGEDLQFSCYDSPCSTYNEGVVFGELGGSENFLKMQSTNSESILVLNRAWIRFINMINPSDGSPIVDDVRLERFQLPEYASELRERFGAKTTVVPLICHPKAFLYCERNINPEKSGQCRCNLLYSDHQNRSGNGETTDICIGRPNSPCGFELKDAFHDEAELRGYPALNPVGLRDGILSPCTSDSDCLPFKDREERNLFRQGLIWHGFGYNPIVVEMILRSATRICKCRSLDGLTENKMHGCVGVSAAVN